MKEKRMREEYTEDVQSICQSMLKLYHDRCKDLEIPFEICIPGLLSLADIIIESAIDAGIYTEEQIKKIIFRR